MTRLTQSRQGRRKTASFFPKHAVRASICESGTIGGSHARSVLEPSRSLRRGWLAAVTRGARACGAGRRRSSPTAARARCRSTSSSCSRSTSPIRWTRRSRRCSARATSTGITSREFMHALRGGMHGKVAVTYFEWAGPYDQKIVVPWRLIEGPESRRCLRQRDRARALPARLAHLDLGRARCSPSRCSTAAAIRGIRRVIDVSGDGANNQRSAGHPGARRPGRGRHHHQRPADHAEAAELASPWISSNLDIYYEDCVIGGPGAFVIPIRERDQFKEAIRTKLVLEIAGRTPPPRVIPAQARAAAHLLHHRRADVAGTLGELMRGAVVSVGRSDRCGRPIRGVVGRPQGAPLRVS